MGPTGASAHNPDGTPVAGKGAYQQQADEDDPFAELRKQEEQMRQQREYWSQWYAQYSAWYSQQSAQQAQGNPSNETPMFERSSQKKSQASSAKNGASRAAAGGATGPGYNPFAEEDAAPPETPSVHVPIRGPPPPRLLAGVEDHAV